MCEYDETVLEYWVNIRTSGTLSREDLQRLSVSQFHEGEATPGLASIGDDMHVAGGFADLGAAVDVATEGDASMQVPSCMHNMFSGPTFP